MKIYPWGELPACHFRRIRKLEAYATVRGQPPLALDSRCIIPFLLPRRVEALDRS